MDRTADPAIMLRNLRKSYGQVVALDGLSLAVPPGSITGLLGPNGSGKTTTVSILSTALRPDGGQALVAGLDVTTHPAEVRRLIGFAGQFAAVDPNLTGRENLRLIGRLSRLPRPVARDRTDEALERFGLAEAAGGWSAATRVACGGASMWRPRSCTAHGCCFSTSRRPAWIRRAARSCGGWSPSWPRTGRRCC